MMIISYLGTECEPETNNVQAAAAAEHSAEGRGAWCADHGPADVDRDGGKVSTKGEHALLYLTSPGVFEHSI